MLRSGLCHQTQLAHYSGVYACMPCWELSQVLRHTPPLSYATPLSVTSSLFSDEYYGTNHWILRRLLSVVLWETMQSVLRNGSFSQAWWYKVVIPAASEAQWEGWEMQVSLGSSVVGCLQKQKRHSCNPSPWEAEARGPGIQGYPALRKQLESSQGYINSCLNTPQTNKQIN